MTTKAQFIQLVDDFMDAEKTIAGVGAPPSWQPNRDGYGQEIKLQLEVGGVQYGSTLVVVSIPSTGAFHLLVLYCGACVSRLDFDDLQLHPNTLFADQDGLPAMVSGHHFHRWSLNKRFIEANGSLEQLKHAEELPTSIRSFDPALRWFCDEMKIHLPHDHCIECPRILI